MIDLESFSIGYLAAIVDGEGTIDLIIRSRGSYNDYLPYVVVFNTEKSIIDSTKDMASVGKIPRPIPPKGNRHKDLYRLWIRQQEDIVYFLERIQPFLMSKRKKRLAELLIEYCLIRLKRNRGARSHGIKLGTHSERENEIWEEVRELNKRAGGEWYEGDNSMAL